MAFVAFRHRTTTAAIQEQARTACRGFGQFTRSGLRQPCGGRRIADVGADEEALQEWHQRSGALTGSKLRSARGRRLATVHEPETDLAGWLRPDRSRHRLPLPLQRGRAPWIMVAGHARRIRSRTRRRRRGGRAGDLGTQPGPLPRTEPARRQPGSRDAPRAPGLRPGDSGRSHRSHTPQRNPSRPVPAHKAGSPHPQVR